MGFVVLHMEKAHGSDSGTTAPATDDEREKQQGEFVTAAMLTDYRHDVHIVMYAKQVNKAGKASRQGRTAHGYLQAENTVAY